MEKKIVIAKILDFSEKVENISIKAADELIVCAEKISKDEKYSENFNTAIDLIASVDYKVAEKMRAEAQGFGLMDKAKGMYQGVKEVATNAWDKVKANQYSGLTEKMTNDVNKVLENFKNEMDTGKLAEGMEKVKAAYGKMGGTLPQNIKENFNKYFTKINELEKGISQAEDQARKILLDFVANTQKTFAQLKNESKQVSETKVEQPQAKTEPKVETNTSTGTSGGSNVFTNFENMDAETKEFYTKLPKEMQQNFLNIVNKKKLGEFVKNSPLGNTKTNKASSTKLVRIA